MSEGSNPAKSRAQSVALKDTQNTTIPLLGRRE